MVNGILVFVFWGGFHMIVKNVHKTAHLFCEKVVASESYTYGHNVVAVVCIVGSV